MNDLIDKRDAEFALQLNTFKNKIGLYQAILGISQSVVDDNAKDADYFSFMVSAMDPSKNYSKGWTQQKNDARNGKGNQPITGFPYPVDVSTPPVAVAPGIEKRFRQLVKQIKSNPSYTTAMGEDLGIVAPAPNPVIHAPELKLAMKGGNPNIRYKRGITEGVRIYSKRGSESSFSFLDVSTRSPYVDTRPNLEANTAETRQYYAYFIVDDAPVGDQSATVSISVA